MRRFIAPLVAVLALAAGNAAADARQSVPSAGRTQSASCAGAVTWPSARRLIGHYATIRGRVAGTKYARYSNGSPTFLNVGVDYPNPSRFTVVIWGANRGRFGAPESRYLGRTICVRGYVDTYSGVAQIEAKSPSQIFVVR